ncbi:MAG: hypothetical protein HW402_1230 [Dehalococcoidales bacterium]|nr:hypothetical protein [Dehalococcoidales bacterium]
MAVDALGDVYVADTYNHRIQKFSGSGAFIAKWGSSGSGNSQFNEPAGVAVDAQGNVYVADQVNNRIQKFTSSGAFITKWGSYGSGDGQFKWLADVAVDSSGNIYVADYDNNRIQKFTSSGAFITKWGSYGSGNSQFYRPVGVAVDALGDVYVADTYNHRIQKFTSSGAFIAKWGSYGSGDGQFNVPHYLTLDAQGNVYVAEHSNNRVQKFTSSGTFITKWGSLGSGDGQFNQPVGVAVDAFGNVFVTDRNNRRVQVFGVPAVPPTVTTDNATNITSNSARLNGTLTSKGTAVSANVSFDWGLSSGNYTFATTPVSVNVTGPFSANLTGLSANTTYYFRARASGDGMGLGVEKSFTTLSPSAPTPDLWLAEKHEVWVVQGSQYIVSFTIKNNGNVSVPSGHDVGLVVDGRKVEQKPVLVSIPAGASYSDNFSTVISLSDGKDDVSVSADVNNEIDESDEGNNGRGNTFAWPPASDLRLSMWEEWTVAGQSYNVRFDVRNRGNAPASGGHIIALYVEDVEIERKTVGVTLAPSENYSDVFNTTTNLTGSADRVKVIADITNLVAESNESNNSYENLVAWPVAPDLRISSKSEQWLTGKEGTQYNVLFTVRNNGNIYVPSGHHVQLKVDGSVIETLVVPVAVSRGQTWSSSFSTNVTISGSSDNITVIADANSEVDESDESNNSRSNTWSVPKPDLTVTEKHEVWVVEGSQYVVGFTVKNDGAASVPAGHDTALLVDGNPIEQKAVPVSLAPGATYSDNFTSVVTISGTSDNITVIADANSEVDESSESNNTRSNTWSSLPDLTVSEMHETWQTGAEGVSYRIFFTIRNPGNVTVPAGHDTALLLDGRLIEQKAALVSLASGATYTDNFTIVISLTGTDDVTLVADFNNEVGESSETNNRRGMTVAWPSVPDLYVSSGKYEEWQVAGQSYVVHFTVANRGNAAAPAGHDAALYVDGVEIERKQVTVILNPFGSYSGVFSTNVTFSGSMDKVRVVADISNAVVESNEGNNTYENTLVWPAAPDLVVNSKTEQWVAGQEGTVYNVRFYVQNIGNANAPAGHKVQLKADGNVIETKTIPVELTPGSSYNSAFSANVTISGTSDNVTVVADANNEVAEGDETNNSRSNTWSSMPDLTVTAIFEQPVHRLFHRQESG